MGRGLLLPTPPASFEYLQGIIVEIDVAEI